MSSHRVFIRPVPKDAKYKPAIRMQFNGKSQAEVYFPLRRIAEQKLDMRQAALARLIVSDWVKLYLKNELDGNVARCQRMTMLLNRPRKVSQKVSHENE